jgi:O-acetyl-ADP-ribose deacetylase (regulator of RNase III)
MLSDDVRIIAIVSFAFGVAFQGLIYLQAAGAHIRTTQTLAWFFFAFAVNMLIFSLFLGATSAEGSILGFTLAGPLAGTVGLWLVASKLTGDASRVDDLLLRLRAVESELHQARTALAVKAIAAPRPMTLPTNTYTVRMKQRLPAEFGIITGALDKVTIADVWVNSENTNMQMSRFFEGNISGTIRYYGAKRDCAGNVVEDTIAKELHAKTGDQARVFPGTVIVTRAGQLQESNGVKRIFHVAAVEGVLNEGYQQTPNIGDCVTRALGTMDSQELQDSGLASILFPLMGTGYGRADLTETAEKLLHAAVAYLQTHKTTRVRKIYFLARSERHLKACQSIFEQMNAVVSL